VYVTLHAKGTLFLFARARKGCLGRARIGQKTQFLQKPKEGTAMAVGKIKWFSDMKGYGFIETGEGKNLFVHFSAVQQQGCQSLHEGQAVTYDIGEGRKGRQAENVVPQTVAP